MKMVATVELHHRMLPILGYKPADLLDKSLYDCHHSVDSKDLMTAFKNGE